MTTATLSPASEKQTAFLNRLAGERDHDIPALHDLIRQSAEGTISKKSASLAIDMLLNLPRKPIVHEDGEATGPGYYMVGDDIFVVVKAKYSDNLYAKRLAGKPEGGVEWAYTPGGMRNLANATRLTVEQAATTGRLHGACIICTKTLSDPESVQRGIGPVCAKRLNVA